MAKREAFYLCVLVSDRNEYEFHFRAWTPEAAEAHFRDALQGSGVSSPGELVIRNRKGEVVRRSTYAPLAGATTPSPQGNG
jgi:hypothetical protein